MVSISCYIVAAYEILDVKSRFHDEMFHIDSGFIA